MFAVYELHSQLSAPRQATQCARHRQFMHTCEGLTTTDNIPLDDCACRDRGHLVCLFGYRVLLPISSARRLHVCMPVHGPAHTYT